MKNIKRWVLETQTKGNIKDIAEYGCVNGACSELIYYHDTSEFYDKHKEEIWYHVSEHAEQSGYTVLNYLSSLDTSIDSDFQFKNIMTWTAVEIVCWEIINSKEVA